MPVSYESYTNTHWYSVVNFALNVLIYLSVSYFKILPICIYLTILKIQVKTIELSHMSGRILYGHWDLYKLHMDRYDKTRLKKLIAVFLKFSGELQTRDVYVLCSAETFSRFHRSPFPDFISLNRLRNINCFNLLYI